MTAMSNVKCGKVLGFISTISFEIYLIHHPFVFGELSWLNINVLTGNIWINGLLAMIVIVFSALVLNNVGKLAAKAIG
jgi:membrane-bound acyltransferase YfiQ involved in biofilm formation